MSEEVWHRGPLVAEQRSESSDTIALLHLISGQSRVLNGTASAIWMLMDGNRCQAQIIAELNDEFDAPAGMIDAQVLEFFKSLAADDLIVPVAKGCGFRFQENDGSDFPI